jgi:hypothetical protein
MAFSVFAQEAPKADKAPVTVSAYVKGGLMWARFTQATKAANDDWDFIDTRMRPWFVISNGDSKAVLGLEIDGHMGGGNATGYDSNKVYVGKGNQKFDTNYIPQNGDRTNIEINECYYESKVKLVDGLSITAGLLEYKFPVYNFGDQNDQFKVAFKNKLVDAKAIYMRWAEGDFQQNCDNSHVWIADVQADLGIAKVRPAVFYIKSGDQVYSETYVKAPTSTASNTKFAGKSGLIYGINADAKVDIIKISATFLYGKGKSAGKITPANKGTYSGYAGKLEVAADVNPVSVKAFFNFTSGDKDYGTGKTKHKDWISMSFDTVGDGNTFILEDKGHSLMTDGKPSRMRVREANPWGYMIYGLQAETKIADLKIKAVLASGQLSAAGKATTTNIAMKKDLGYEGDLQFLYGICEGTDLVVEGAYLFTGKAFETVGYAKTTDTTAAWTNRATVAAGKTKTNNVKYIGLGTKYAF